MMKKLFRDHVFLAKQGNQLCITYRGQADFSWGRHVLLCAAVIIDYRNPTVKDINQVVHLAEDMRTHIRDAQIELADL